MKRWKKIVLGLVILLVLSQAPFAYRHYKLKRLKETINQLNSQRLTSASDVAFVEYVGVMHVHSFLGGHSSGTFEAIITGAQANHLNFVVMTEHTSKDFDTSAMTLAGEHGGIVFLNGNEVALENGDRFLAVPGSAAAAADAGRTTTGSERVLNAATFVAYPREFRSWQTAAYDGVEVYNVFTNSRRINPVMMFFDGLWSYRSYPELLFANFYERPTAELTLWDQALAQTGRRLVATAGNDAHANVGLSLNDSAGKKLLGIQLDPYERSFRLVRMHVLVPNGQEFNSKSLQAALVGGHCFIGFDIFGDTSGFRFYASNGGGSRIQGDEITLDGTTRLFVSTPAVSRVLLFHDGRVIREQAGHLNVEFEVKEKGVYRVEVYLPQLPRPVSDQPWIISNPIYVR